MCNQRVARQTQQKERELLLSASAPRFTLTTYPLRGTKCKGAVPAGVSREFHDPLACSVSPRRDDHARLAVALPPAQERGRACSSSPDRPSAPTRACPGWSLREGGF